jgi:hypothetical protein
MRHLPRIAVLAVLAALLTGCTKVRSSTQKEEPIKPVATLTADQLLDEYKKNEVGADQKYKDKPVQITGKVSEVRKDLFGRYFIGLGTAQEGEMFDIMCYLSNDKETEEATGKLQKGQTVTLVGNCQGRAGGLALNLKYCFFPTEAKAAPPASK